MLSKHRFQRLALALPSALLVMLVSDHVLAQTTWSSDPAVETKQTAKARYDADKKLCADESSSEARLQCRRDALSVYDKALASLRKGTYSTKSSAAACADCGKVTAVHVVDKQGDSNAVGLIAGGVAGAVLGHQIGGGMGKDLATIAGAAGGAYAGKKVQENMNTTKVWQVSVTYTDGGTAKFDFAQDPGFKVGDPVKKSGNTLERN
ncbi:glycine zipper 2TM domain-containing protein [Rhodoferax sp.]|uniref:glycine zipper 2TM domain-containing protein n=1 Tax=Rhodoferax sp. TaxID=50421 RepID=UPI00284B4E79|nr:glycine zipper 2TM domain-containing protein [Rhodoferax sp.]MDR3367880.1 glycine zipper 2TM domain-containing protein [Rhodoferax sp.]